MTPKQWIVFSILGLLAVVASYFFWLMWQEFLLQPFAWMSLSKTLLPWVIKWTVSLVVFLALFSLVQVLVSQKYCWLVISLFFAAALVPVFYNQQIVLLLSFVLFLLATLLVGWQTRSDMGNHIKLAVGHVFSPRLSLFYFLVTIILASQYWWVASQNIHQFKFEIPQEIFDQVMGQIEGFIQSQTEGMLDSFKEEQQVNDEKVLGSLMIENLPQEYQQILQMLPQEVQEQLRQGQIPEELKPYFPKEVVEKGSFSLDELQQVLPALQQTFLGPVKTEIEAQINQIIERIKPALPILFAVFLFFLLYYLGILIRMVTTVVLAILVKLLVLARIAEIKKETVEAERIVVE